MMGKYIWQLKLFKIKRIAWQSLQKGATDWFSLMNLTTRENDLKFFSAIKWLKVCIGLICLGLCGSSLALTNLRSSSVENQAEQVIKGAESVDIANYYQDICSVPIVELTEQYRLDYIVRQITKASLAEWLTYIQEKKPGSSAADKFAETELECTKEEQLRFKNILRPTVIDSITSLESNKHSLLRFPSSLPNFTRQDASAIINRKLDHWKLLPTQEIADIAIALTGHAYDYAYLRSSHIAQANWNERKAIELFEYVYDKTQDHQYLYNMAYWQLKAEPEAAKLAMEKAAKMLEPRALVWTQFTEICETQDQTSYLEILEKIQTTQMLPLGIVNTYKRLYSIEIDNYGCHRKDLKYLPFMPLDMVTT